MNGNIFALNHDISLKDGRENTSAHRSKNSAQVKLVESLSLLRLFQEHG